jgi:hypothetical protein
MLTFSGGGILPLRPFAITLVCCLCTVACARQPAVDVIRAMVVKMGAAAESRRGPDVMFHVSDDFIGNDGEVDRARLVELLRTRLVAGHSIGVRLSGIDVEMTGDRAIARFDATLTDVSGRWLPQRRIILELETGWRSESCEWRCYNARWKQVP